jgi:phosphoribosylanthranilate isomerase
MTWIKLCGLRTREDVAVAVEAGADAIGFVTAAGSPRRVSPSHAAAIGVDVSIERFLVTFDLTPEALLRDAEAAGVTGVQPHGRHAAVAARAAFSAGFRVLLPVDIGVDPDLSAAAAGMTPICDGPRPGSGIGFDWARLDGIDRDYVLAGGLNLETIGDALERLHPYGVDVSSGIERDRGVKDHDLMRRFVEAVR